jgi:hypothetical protein
LNEISTRGENEILVPVLLLSYYVTNAEGKRMEALKFLDAATRAPQVEPHAFDLAIDEYEKDRKWADAARVIQLRQDRVGRADKLLPRLIANWRRAGQPEKMQSALHECRATEEFELIAACELSAQPDPPPVPPEGGAPAQTK